MNIFPCRHHHQIVEQQHTPALKETEERTAGQVGLILHSFLVHSLSVESATFSEHDWTLVATT